MLTLSSGPAVSLSKILALLLAPVRLAPINLPSRLITLSAKTQYSGLLLSSVRVAHSLVCCRVVLNLRQAASSKGTYPTMSVDLVFATFSWEHTNQEEAELPETCGTCSHDEELRTRAGDDFVTREGMAL